jgi:uncharacterized protein (TIGR00730 family)
MVLVMSVRACSPRRFESVCIFCGSRPGHAGAFATAASAFGRAVARRGLTLVYGGAKVGLMGAVADAALAEGGRVVGVIPRSLVSKEVAHDGLSELFLTETMAERKERMVALSDGFVALPGGLGTYDEIFETLTLGQLGIHDKPNALLDVAGFFRPVVDLVRHTVEAGFASPADLELLLVDEDPERLLDALAAWVPPERGPKWVSP